MKILFLIIGTLWLISALIIPVGIFIRKINEKRGISYVFKISFKEWILPSILNLISAGACLYVAFRI